MRRCGEDGQCICDPGWYGADCSVETAEPTCGCGQYGDGCQGSCDMFEDCSGNGRCVYASIIQTCIHSKIKLQWLVKVLLIYQGYVEACFDSYVVNESSWICDICSSTYQ